jgi:hypothetical protein
LHSKVQGIAQHMIACCLHSCCSSTRKQPQGHGPPSDWRAIIPNSGTLSLDYVSTHPPGCTTSTTVWGALPQTAAAAGTAAAGSASSSTAGGAARTSAVGTAAAAVSVGRNSQAGAASGTRSKSNSLSGAAAAGAAGAGAAQSGLSAISDQQLELLMKNQVGFIDNQPTPGLSKSSYSACAVITCYCCGADAW